MEVKASSHKDRETSVCVCVYICGCSQIYALLLSNKAYYHGRGSHLTWSKIIQKGSFILILWAFPASDWFCLSTPLPPKTEVHTFCAVLGWAMVMHLITLWTSPGMSRPSTRCWSLWVNIPSCGRRTAFRLSLIAAVQGSDKLLGCFVGISQCYLQCSNGMIGCDCKHNND